MPTMVTWNMRGANWTSDMKWRTGVANLFTNGADVACLQECGAIPESATHVWQSPLDPALNLYAWGTLRSRRHILYYHWDLVGNRVNLAIVTRQALAVANVLPLVYPGPGAPSLRPAIGVTLGMYSYYCVHAISPGGPDVPALLAAIGAAAPGGIAVVGGDFNRAPAGALGGQFLCPPDGNTYSTTLPASRYDYAYTNAPIKAGTIGKRVGLIASDHFPVAFGF